MAANVLLGRVISGESSVTAEFWSHPAPVSPTRIMRTAHYFAVTVIGALEKACTPRPVTVTGGWDGSRARVTVHARPLLDGRRGRDEVTALAAVVYAALGNRAFRGVTVEK